MTSFAFEPRHSIATQLHADHPPDRRVDFQTWAPLSPPTRYQLASQSASLEVTAPYSQDRFSARLALVHRYSVKIDFHNTIVEGIFRDKRVKIPLDFGADEHIRRLHVMGGVHVIVVPHAVPPPPAGETFGEARVHFLLRHSHTIEGYPRQDARILPWTTSASATNPPAQTQALDRLDYINRSYSAAADIQIWPNFTNMNGDVFRLLDVALASEAPGPGLPDFEYRAIREWSEIAAWRAVVSTGALGTSLVVRFDPLCPWSQRP